MLNKFKKSFQAFKIEWKKNKILEKNNIIIEKKQTKIKHDFINSRILQHENLAKSNSKRLDNLMKKMQEQPKIIERKIDIDFNNKTQRQAKKQR